MNYVRHIVSAKGVEPGKDKVRAIMDMPTPTTKEEVRRFVGLVQYLAKFLLQRNEVNKPLGSLTKKDVEFQWAESQQKSFNKLKELCSTAPVLVRFDGDKDIQIQCDTSQYAVGAFLLQDGKPVAYTSRALTQPESMYAHIEKETLAMVHACKKFHYYVFDRHVIVQSDHKPLCTITRKPHR